MSGVISILNPGRFPLFQVPVGTIVAYSGTIAGIPSGWTLCDGTGGTPNLSDHFVIGEDATYTYDTSGGASTSAIGGVSGSGGAHSSAVQNTESGTNSVGNDVDGVHTHALSGTMSAIPAAFSYIYIMATAGGPLPALAVLWLNDVVGNIPANMTEETNLQGRFAKGVNTDTRAPVGGNGEDVALTMASDGYHVHGTPVAGWAIGGSPYSEAVGRGAHSDTPTKTFDYSLPPYFVLTAVQVTSDAVPTIYLVAGYYGSLASLPGYWKVCDGTNGTPNMAGRLPLGADSATYTLGATGGAASRTGTTTDVTHSASHKHGSNADATGAATSQHDTYAWSHTHTIPSQALDMPPWHSLHFIMLAL